MRPLGVFSSVVLIGHPTASPEHGRDCALFLCRETTKGKGRKSQMKKLLMIAAMACFATVVFAQGQNMPNVSEIKQKAEAGDVTAQAQYAHILYFGQGAEKNEKEAVKWYQKAADGGNDYAQANMGVFCQTGNCGITKDLAKAVEWYDKAAKQGNAYAQYYLACLYSDGNGVEKNVKKAVELYEKAANGGMPIAQYIYAMILGQGKDVDRNVDEALKWAEKAAAAGEGRAAKLISTLKNMKEMDNKTPKSLLGVVFGDDIYKWKSKYTYGKVETTKDGTSLIIESTPPKKFRKFLPDGRFQLYGTLDSKKIYKFLWNSEHFPDGTSDEMADEEVLATCSVIAKKFGSECKKNGKAFEVKVGWLTVNIEAHYGYMTMTVVHSAYEDMAKEECEARKTAQGDGSDAL